MNLTFAYSPCPNDTFMFHAIAAGLVKVDGHDITTHLHDVETLNRYAGDTRFDLTKLSFHAWLIHRERYHMLPVGAALGFGCGPLVVARQEFTRANLADLKVALPGELTTAHLLLRLWQPACAQKIFVAYDQVFAAVTSGQADAGVIIHEGRFTFKARGLRLVADLGEWWSGLTGLPIPLGCIAVKRTIAADLRQGLAQALRQSIDHARQDPRAPLAYMQGHAQELDPQVMQQHVSTYVNDFSLDLGEPGRAAVSKLEQMFAGLEAQA